MYNDFNKDLKIGERAEKLILEQLKLEFEDIKKKKGKFSDYDLYSVFFDTTWEVKFDYMSRITGNIAIEYFGYGKPSGITVSKADYWISIYMGRTWIAGQIEMEELKRLCKSKNYKRVLGGDENKQRMILIPWQDFELKSSTLLQILDT